ncbi:MAG: hypothetical protein JW730_18385 [Anaerolineales bacterium]|nr:hypothetical protein [Anaerolineales bacterium]
MTEDYLSISQLSRRAGMSADVIRRHLHEIRHLRHSPRGKVWIRASDFEAWYERKAKAVRADEEVLEFIEGLKWA